MATKSLSFENFAQGYPGSALTSELMHRMFGDGVCAGAVSPCRLTPRAQAWMSEANGSMTGGRCEGFAVLSSLFAAGSLDPVDFGGSDARSLKLEGNVKLQQEIAYWFSTQLVGEVVASKTKGYMAKDVMPFLAQALKKGATEQYRIGIVKKKGSTISGGHSLTPIGYYADKEEGVYLLRVYDNNNPDAERLLKIDTKNNRWEYEAARNPKAKSSLYVGDATNKNPLYFAPVLPRLGTLPCKFCNKTPGAHVVTHGGIQALVKGAGDKVVGYANGEVTAVGGSATPTFSAELDSEPASFSIDIDDVSAVSLSLSGPERDPDEALLVSEQTVKAFGPNYVVGMTGLKLDATATDAVEVAAGGTEVKYENNSRTPIGLSSQVELRNGKTLEVTVRVASSGALTTRIDPATGDIAVATLGTAGEPVTVSVTQTNADGTTQQGQLAYTGADAGTLSVRTNAWTADGGALEGTVDNGGGPMPVTNACEDRVKSGMETDVDCGRVCARRCGLGQGCLTGADCDSALCHATTLKCVADACADGAKNFAETDVDCGGGSCRLCGASKACALDSDCQSGACRGALCVETYAVGLTVTGLPPGKRAHARQQRRRRAHPSW